MAKKAQKHCNAYLAFCKEEEEEEEEEEEQQEAQFQHSMNLLSQLRCDAG